MVIIMEGGFRRVSNSESTHQCVPARYVHGGFGVNSCSVVFPLLNL